MNVVVECIEVGRPALKQLLVQLESAELAPARSAPLELVESTGDALAGLKPEALLGERVQSLEHELAHSRENLQASIEELEASNEELQATNEELVASTRSCRAPTKSCIP